MLDHIFFKVITKHLLERIDLAFLVNKDPSLCSFFQKQMQIIIILANCSTDRQMNVSQIHISYNRSTKSKALATLTSLTSQFTITIQSVNHTKLLYTDKVNPSVPFKDISKLLTQQFLKHFILKNKMTAIPISQCQNKK